MPTREDHLPCRQAQGGIEGAHFGSGAWQGSDSGPLGRKPASPGCGTCTIRLVALAYERAPWFRLIREPLRAGMLVFSRLHRIDVSASVVRSEACRGCVRFHKNLLKERSPMFRLLNRLVNPVFDGILVRIVGPAAISDAKVYARSATSGDDVASDGEGEPARPCDARRSPTASGPGGQAAMQPLWLR